MLPRALHLILAPVRRTDKHVLESLSDEVRELTKFREASILDRIAESDAEDFVQVYSEFEHEQRGSFIDVYN